MDELRRLSSQRKKAHKRLLDLKSGTYAAFLDMERATYRDGHLPKKAKELIAVGISVVIDCRSCMQWHIEQAAEGGATLKEILEAVEVGMEMGRRPGHGFGALRPYGARGRLRPRRPAGLRRRAPGDPQIGRP